MKRSLIAALFCIAAATPVAWAGSKSVYPINISTTGRYAEGAVGSARNSADTSQLLGCGLTAYSTGSASGYCAAQNAAGVSVLCNTDAPDMIAQIRGLSTDAYVRFYWDASGVCTSLFVSKFSTTEPKAP